MLDNHALPYICEAKPSSLVKWFAYLSDIINHPLLDDEEKLLGCWLATQFTNNESFRCSFSYEQISQAVNKSSRKVHRILSHLRAMGFFIADIPIYYGELSAEMVYTEYTFKMILTRPPFSTEVINGIVLPYRKNRPKINLNLIKPDGKIAK